eukprot:jgi/Psemu1/285840/fgenesh1_pg.104_\
MFFDTYVYHDEDTNVYLNQYPDTYTEIYHELPVSPLNKPYLHLMERRVSNQTELDLLLTKVDALNHVKCILAILHNMLTTYQRLLLMSQQYETILLQARGLQAKMSSHDTRCCIPLEDPLMYFLSSNVTKLLILLDTRASCSITPTISDFMERLAKSRLGHADLQRVQALLRQPHQPRGSDARGELVAKRVIIPSDKKGASSCKLPKCKAGQYAKQKRTAPVNPKHPDSDYEEGSLTNGQLEPGAQVSCDQYMSATLGRLSHTFGKEDKQHQLVGGTIFVDHTTNYIFYQHQANLTVATSL